MKHPNALLCREDSDSSACIRPDVKATPPGHSLVFEKNPDFLYKHIWGKRAYNRQDTRATSFRGGLNKKTCEVCYGKAIAQFTVWMLYAFVQAPPREI
jgi:hypothetical protein